MDPHTHVYVWEPRYDVIRTLLKLRGLKKVRVIEGPYVNRECKEVMEEAMGLERGATNRRDVAFEERVKPPVRKKYSFK